MKRRLILGALVLAGRCGGRFRDLTREIVDHHADGLPGAPYFDVAAASYRVTHFRPPVPQYPQISEQVATAIQKAVAGQATPKAALDAAAANVDKLLAGQ